VSARDGDDTLAVSQHPSASKAPDRAESPPEASGLSLPGRQDR